MAKAQKKKGNDGGQGPEGERTAGWFENDDTKWIVGTGIGIIIAVGTAALAVIGIVVAMFLHFDNKLSDHMGTYHGPSVTETLEEENANAIRQSEDFTTTSASGLGTAEVEPTDSDPNQSLTQIDSIR